MVSSYLQLLRRRYHGQIDEDADEFIDFAVGRREPDARADRGSARLLARRARSAEPRPVDTGLVVADVLSSLAAAIADARAEVHVGPMPAVMGDRVAIAQLFQNLVANALKFRRGPGACVWVARSATARCGSSRWPTTGSGSRPRHHERVFKMFQRLHDRESFDGHGDRAGDLPQDRRAPGRADLGRRRARAAARVFSLHAARGPAAACRSPRPRAALPTA